MNRLLEYIGLPCVLEGSILSLVEILICLSILLVFVVLLLKLYRQYLVRQSKLMEYWLPIVDDEGNVKGRVARSVSLETPGKYQHPMIRIMIFRPGGIYLTHRSFEYCPDFGLYDHPIEYMMEFGKSVEESISDLQKKFFPNCPQPGFLLKYKHENEIGQWQVLLYCICIPHEEELTGVNKSHGKFWTISQIQENTGKSWFSKLFEGEFDFIKTLTGLD